METHREEPADRLRSALAMFDFTLSMFRQRLRRDRPGITEIEIEDEIARWLCERPGAEHGDAEGVAVAWPRR